jgi:hypothetical protein
MQWSVASCQFSGKEKEGRPEFREHRWLLGECAEAREKRLETKNSKLDPQNSKLFSLQPFQ